MREEGYVSLWLGEAKSLEVLDNYVQLGFSAEGDLLPSQFMNDFSLRSYDTDFMEVEHLEYPERSIGSLLEGFSYDDQLIRRFEQTCGNAVDFDVNAIVLLYNYRVQSPSVAITERNNVRLRFIGVAEYRIQ